MLIHFKNHKLKKEFSSEKELARVYGGEQGRMFMRRISELKAARCLADLHLLPQLCAYELAGERTGQISITARQPYFLILLIANEPVTKVAHGVLDWATITEVTIFEVVDTHP